MLRVLLVLVLLALWISSIIDVVRTPSPATRALPKWAWLLIVVVLPLIGGLIWVLLGRERPEPGRYFRRRSPAAPDDDPQFLRRLEEEAWKRRMRDRRGEV
jgi:hypothetical protein